MGAKTPEQREAVAKLNEAIEVCIQAYASTRDYATPDLGLIQEWIVVVAEVTPGETPDDDIQSYSILMSQGGIPWHRAYGLLQAGIRHLNMVEDVNE